VDVAEGLVAADLAGERGIGREMTGLGGLGDDRRGSGGEDEKKEREENEPMNFGSPY
jgi:hypothetical protein